MEIPATTKSKETTMIINDREFKVVSIFSGENSASELLHNLAIKRILNENLDRAMSNGIKLRGNNGLLS